MRSGASDAFDDHILELQARLIQALAHPTRLKILQLVGDGELSAGALAERLGVTRPNLSQHLTLMQQRGLLRVRREGATRLYRLAYPEIKDACAMFREVLAAELAAAGRVFGRPARTTPGSPRKAGLSPAGRGARPRPGPPGGLPRL